METPRTPASHREANSDRRALRREFANARGATLSKWHSLADATLPCGWSPVRRECDMSGMSCFDFHVRHWNACG
jgi:hypothetical protein